MNVENRQHDRGSGFFGRIPSLIVSLRWFSLLLAAIIFFIAVFTTPTAKTGRSIEDMFGSRDASVQSFRRIKEIFGDRETVLVVYKDPELFNPDGSGVRKLAKYSEAIEALPQVEEVLSLERLQEAIEALQPLANPLNALANSGNAKQSIMNPDNSLAQGFLETFDGWTHSRSNNLAVLVCLISSPAQQTDPEVTAKTVSDLRQIVQDLPDAHVVGEPVMVEDGLAYLKQDGRWLQFGAMILLGSVILIMLRTIKWLMVTACVVVWSNVVTIWLLSVLHFEQTMISSLLGSIIAVIGVATTIHLVVGYRICRVSGDSRSLAMRRSVSQLLPPIFWACMTDAAGFFSLSVANVHAVQSFGQMMAIASLVTLASICLLTPGLILIGPKETSQASGVGQKGLESALTMLLGWVNRNSRLVSVVVLISSLFAAGGCLFLKVETDFTKNFRANTPIMEGYQFVEQEFGGAGLIDIAVQTPSALNADFLTKVKNFQEELRAIRFPSSSAGQGAASDSPRLLAKVLSQVDAIETAQSIPALRLLPADTIVTGMRQVLPGFTNHWYHWDKSKKRGYLRIFARTRQQQDAAAKRFLIQEIQRISEEYFGSEATVKHQLDLNDPQSINEASTELLTGTEQKQPYLVSGMFVLLTRLVDSLLADHLATTTAASIAIGLLLWIALGDLRLAAIALVPNLLPILVILGVLGWLGIALNMGVAMIAAVSIGLSVDSSIHYLWPLNRRYKNRSKLNRRGETKPFVVSRSTELKSQSAVEDSAIKDKASPDIAEDLANTNHSPTSAEIQTRIGTALTYSSLTLIIGFLSLTKSDFIPTVFFGSLVSAAMLGGLIGNLVLLPALLRSFGLANRD